MLFLRARAPARQDSDSRPIPLAEQDRNLWQREMIAEGVGLLDLALTLRSPGPYQLQAAITAIHAQATSVASTDWAQIALLYDSLAHRLPSPVVDINRAVAVGMPDGPHAGLALLEPILASGALDMYAPLHAAHADLLDHAGDSEAATDAWARAIATTSNASLRSELERRIAARSSRRDTDISGSR